MRYQPEILSELITHYSYQLKFVVSSEKDIPEIASVIAETGADTDRVLLMPEGTQPEVLRERSRWLAGLCKDLKYRFCPRIHIQIWGDQRGV